MADLIISTCIRKLSPHELLPWFINNKIQLDLCFKYDLLGYYINFYYSKSNVMEDDLMHIDEYNAIFSMFPNIIITSVAFASSPSYGSLKMMFDECGLKYDNLKRVYVQNFGEIQDLDVSILNKCVNIVDFSVDTCRLKNVGALFECEKLRSLSFRGCILPSELKYNLNLFERIKKVVWINTTPQCDFPDASCKLKSIGLCNENIKYCKNKIRAKKLEINKCDEINVNLVKGGEGILMPREVFGRVKNLVIYDCDDFRGIDCSGLTSVKIVGCQNFVELVGCELLQTLVIENCSQIVGLDFLKECNKLMKIHFTQCENLCVDFSVFRKCWELDEIKIVECKSIINLRKIGYLHKKLKKFELCIVNGYLDVSELQGCSKLVCIDVGCTRVENIKLLGSGMFPELVKVMVYNIVDGLDWLSGLKELRYFGLVSGNIKSLNGLGGCKKLCVVYIGGCEELNDVSGFECEHFYVTQCKKLTSLIGLGSERLKNIIVSKCKKLVSFDFCGEYKCVKNVSIVKSAIYSVEELSMCLNLERISINTCNIFNVNGLKYCTGLREVSIANCNIIHDLVPLEYCKKLRWLRVGQCMSLKKLGNLMVNGEPLRDEYVIGCAIPSQYSNTFTHNMFNIIGTEKFSNLILMIKLASFILLSATFGIPNFDLIMCKLNKYQTFCFCCCVCGTLIARLKIRNRMNKKNWMCSMIDNMWMGHFIFELCKYFYGLVLRDVHF